MSDDPLFAPWRMEWIRRDDQGEGFEECVFCELPERDDDATHRLLARSEHAYAVLNKAPYCPGHTLVVPREHVADYESIDPGALLDLHRLQQAVMRAIRGAMHPDGMNVGMNLGSAGGASVADHLHVHVVPRWEADTTFMPVVGDTSVVPEALDETYVHLRSALAEREGIRDEGDGAARLVTDP